MPQQRCSASTPVAFSAGPHTHHCWSSHPPRPGTTAGNAWHLWQELASAVALSDAVDTSHYPGAGMTCQQPRKGRIAAQLGECRILHGGGRRLPAAVLASCPQGIICQSPHARCPLSLPPPLPAPATGPAAGNNPLIGYAFDEAPRCNSSIADKNKLACTADLGFAECASARSTAPSSHTSRTVAKLLVSRGLLAAPPLLCWPAVPALNTPPPPLTVPCVAAVMPTQCPAASSVNYTCQIDASIVHMTSTT